MERGEATPKATGELVERSTYQAYGGTESDYRPERWKSFREDYRFTGKEEDVEAGLIYFGKRFLNPLLNRWVSADPLAIHGLGADPNLYAYVSGRVLQSVDPLGLEGESRPSAEEVQTSLGISKEDWASATPERREQAFGWYEAKTESWRRSQQVLRDMQATGAVEGVAFLKKSAEATADFIMAANMMLIPGAPGYALTESMKEDPVGTAFMIVFPAQALANDTTEAVKAAEEPGDIGGAVGYNLTQLVLIVGSEIVGGVAASETAMMSRLSATEAKVGTRGSSLMSSLRRLVTKVFGGCFVAGTQVITWSGPKPIEEVREGDLVLSMPEAGDETGEPVWRRVEAAYKRTTAILDLTLEAPDGTVAKIGTTHEHPFWVGGRGWMGAGEIRPDDYVWSLERGWLWVRSVHERPDNEPVYNVRVADDHTYFVSALGVWVHNADCPELPPTEAYNRQKHYGRTPTAADRRAIGAGADEVADHNPPLVERYYNGDPATGEKPGYQMTPAERKTSGQDRSRMEVQPRAESNAQGGRLKAYAARAKKWFGL